MSKSILTIDDALSKITPANYYVYSDDGKFMVIIPDGTVKKENEIIKTIFDE